MKTWELLKRIDEMGKNCIDEEYKLLNDTPFNEKGDFIIIGLAEYGVALFKGFDLLKDITGTEKWERVEPKYYLQDTFIAKSDKKESYLNFHKKTITFSISDRKEYSGEYQVKFTDGDIERLGIPVERYKKIKVED